MMQMLGSFAEFERAMVRERTRAGAEIARIFRLRRATISRIAAAARAIPAKAELVSSLRAETGPHRAQKLTLSQYQ